MTPDPEPVSADTTGKLVNGAEIARLLGVTRERVHQLRQTPGFPRPVDHLPNGRLWWREDVERWAGEWRREPGRPVSNGAATRGVGRGAEASRGDARGTHT